MSDPSAAASPFHVRVPNLSTTIPLILDSPHSGTAFPPGFRSLAPLDELRTAWDAFVGELWSGAAANGATVLEANFPRVVIDANRAADDINPDEIEGSWPPEWGPLQPTRYSERGMGLIRRDILPGRPLYASPPSAAEIRCRLDTLYTPYHKALAGRIGALHGAFGAVWHINCHSMKSVANAMNIDQGQARPDMVLGDLDGSSCEPEFTGLVASRLREFGYRVACNTPYKGGEIVRRYGDPAQGQHSLQIEINRALYMNEASFERGPGFEALQQNLTRLCQDIAAHIRTRTSWQPRIQTPA